MQPRPLRAALSVLLGAIFLAGLTGEAYGVHECPHHHRDGTPGHASDAGVETAAGTGKLPLQAPPDGPCTCVGNCHAAAVALDAPAPPSLPAALTSDLREASRVDRGRIPRTAAYLLPFANAPPAIPA